MLGLIELPVWGYVVVALVVTHITIAGVTLYLHRCMAHRGVDMHPLITHPMRFWLWATTAMVNAAPRASRAPSRSPAASRRAGCSPRANRYRRWLACRSAGASPRAEQHAQHGR